MAGPRRLLLLLLGRLLMEIVWAVIGGVRVCAGSAAWRGACCSSKLGLTIRPVAAGAQGSAVRASGSATVRYTCCAATFCGR